MAQSILEFSLEFGCLWRSSPIPGKPSWLGGEILPTIEGKADVGFLTIMQKRRLSPLARAAIAVAWRCRTQCGDLPVVAFSSHGESQLYFEILTGQATGEEASPTQFSLSVHNAIVGMLSNLAESSQPYLCLAGGSEGVFGAFLETAAQLVETPKVLLLAYGQPLPEIYSNYVPNDEHSWALGFVLAGKEKPGLGLRLTRTVTGSANNPSDGGLPLLEALATGCYEGVQAFERSCWHWNLADV